MSISDRCGVSRTSKSIPGMAKERRKHPRREFLLAVRYPTANTFMEDYTQTVSSGGVFIATRRQFSIGEELLFEISFPELLQPVACRGEVRYVRSEKESGPEAPAGIGVKFLFDKETQANRQDKLMNEVTVLKPQKASTRHPPKTYQVLLLDESLLSLHLLSRALLQFQGVGSLGVCHLFLTKTQTGTQAWEHLKLESFDLAIVDYFSSQTGELDLIRKIRSHPSTQTLPVVITTEKDEVLQSEVLEAGADELLYRPFALEDLLSTLRRFLKVNLDQ